MLKEIFENIRKLKKIKKLKNIKKSVDLLKKVKYNEYNIKKWINALMKKSNSMMIFREQMMVEYLYESWMKEHFGAANRNCQGVRVDLAGITPLIVKDIE